MTTAAQAGLLDEVYERLEGTGPEFDGWLSNHGPMAADALIRMGRGELVGSWVSAYAGRLQEAPRPRWTVEPSQWREVLGDPSRLGDWTALFDRELQAQPWEQVLATWWPRLLPGAVAAATHPLIRTGHCVRALRELVTGPRLRELAQALGYWAARWQPLPPPHRPRGQDRPRQALDAIAALDQPGGIRTRLDELARSATWPPAVERLRPASGPEAVPAALDELVDAAVTQYLAWGHASPVLLVHTATAPRAAALVLPVLPLDQWVPTHDLAWRISAALSAMYRPAATLDPAATRAPGTRAPGEVVDLAVATGDEHAIKFLEVALESHGRGNALALPAGARAAQLLAGT